MLFRCIVVIVFFVLLTGMRIILKDGNYVDVDSYYFHNDKIVFKLGNKIFELSEKYIDKKATMKLNFLEENRISVFKSYTSFMDRISNPSKLEIEQKIETKNAFTTPKIKIETRKEKNPFFSDEPKKDENFFEKIQRRGIMIKLQIPVKEEDK